MLVPALLAAALSTPAAAADAEQGPITWGWQPGEKVQFISEMLLDSPTVIWFFGVENTQARMFRVEMRAQYACVGESKGKRGFELTCDIEDVSMSGTAVPKDQDQVDGILREYEGILKKAQVQIVTRPDGHISLVDLENVSTGFIRENDIVEVLRQLVRRSVSPLGMQTPKGGNDPGRVWRHKGPNAFFEVMSKFGSSGGMRYEYAMAGMDGDVARITAEGKATVASNTQREQGLPASLSLVASSSYRFDTAAGQVAYGEVAVNGVTTASYSLPGQTQGFGFGARVMRVNADGSVEGPEGAVQ